MFKSVKGIKKSFMGNIRLNERIEKNTFFWSTGFDAGDLSVKGKEEIFLEDLLFLSDSDPLLLLEQYAEIVARPHPVQILPKSPVSWCSWYPYRLGVREEDILKNACIARDRLKPLGLSIIEVDLGWEKGHLPSTYEENKQFPHGLKWLSEKLSAMGFMLGAWKAPYTISEVVG